MPELPEVESTVKRIEPDLVGRSIKDLWIGWSRSIYGMPRSTFLKRVAGSRIKSVSRRAKYIWIEFECAEHLFIHLRMSGNLLVKPPSYQAGPHDRLIARLSNKRQLVFQDTRKFGRWKLVRNPHEITGALGVEPLGKDFNSRTLTEILDSRSGAIKPLLLNQSVIAGIGNIYADEALWKSQIHPLTNCNLVPEKNRKQLVRAIKSTLKRAIELQGTDFGDDVITEGGDYRPRAYGREGLKCFRCSDSIQRILVAQRSSHFCPSCQERRSR